MKWLIRHAINSSKQGQNKLRKLVQHIIIMVFIFTVVYIMLPIAGFMYFLMLLMLGVNFYLYYIERIVYQVLHIDYNIFNKYAEWAMMAVLAGGISSLLVWDPILLADVVAVSILFMIFGIIINYVIELLLWAFNALDR